MACAHDDRSACPHMNVHAGGPAGSGAGTQGAPNTAGGVCGVGSGTADGPGNDGNQNYIAASPVCTSDPASGYLAPTTCQVCVLVGDVSAQSCAVPACACCAPSVACTSSSGRMHGTFLIALVLAGTPLHSCLLANGKRPGWSSTSQPATFTSASLLQPQAPSPSSLTCSDSCPKQAHPSNTSHAMHTCRLRTHGHPASPCASSLAGATHSTPGPNPWTTCVTSVWSHSTSSTSCHPTKRYAPPHPHASWCSSEQQRELN